MGQALNPSPTPSQMCGLRQASQLPHVLSGLGFFTAPPDPGPMGPACQQVPTAAHLIAAWELG